MGMCVSIFPRNVEIQIGDLLLGPGAVDPPCAVLLGSCHIGPKASHLPSTALPHILQAGRSGLQCPASAGYRTFFPQSLLKAPDERLTQCGTISSNSWYQWLLYIQRQVEPRK